MPVPTTIDQLSPTASVNSPAGSENVFPDADNFIRALAAFIAQLRDGAGTNYTSPYLLKTGGTMTGFIVLNADPASAMQPATKQYADTKLAASAYTAADVLAKLLTVDGPGSGLNADLLDGNSSSFYLAASSYTAADVLAKLLTVDGAGSGIDADLLDGNSSAAFALSAITISAGAGLSGGGNLTANRTLSIATNSNGHGIRTVSTSAPSGTPADGDIWLQYE